MFVRNEFRMQRKTFQQCTFLVGHLKQDIEYLFSPFFDSNMLRKYNRGENAISLNLFNNGGENYEIDNYYISYCI